MRVNIFTISLHDETVRRTHGFVIAADFLELGRQRQETTLTDAQLVEGHLQLTLHLVVMGLQFLKSKTIPTRTCNNITDVSTRMSCG